MIKFIWSSYRLLVKKQGGQGDKNIKFQANF